MSNKKLKNYILIQNLANGLASPFMSFLAAVIGVPNVGISIVSSATSFFSGIVQLPLRRVKRVEQLLKFSTLLLAVLWFIMAFIAYGNPIMYLIIYVLIAGVGGANSFAWALIMERLSRGSRGWVLANFAFYGSIGSLLATLITGIIVGSNYAIMHYVFMTTASLIFINAINVWSIELTDPSDQVVTEPLLILKNNRKLAKFLLINTLFAIVWSFAWPLFPLAQVYLLNMNVEQLAIVNVISGISTLTLQRFVGRWFDKNRKLVMFLGRLLLVTFPLSYALANNVYVIYLANMVAGFTNSASNVAYISFVYDNSEDRRTAVSLYNLFYGVGTLIGSLISGALVTVVANYVGLKDSVRYMLLGDAAARALMATLYISV
ncbi:MFS transporter [Vulcanisaeta distributa]|uniref:Major facilitator superfamily MFS_1 n=1 Tax=Vulcanisaeta distributa (strain DSM 14429 / JCM 11212 / NBRC 100878 / IC-017) TaxID=572478 RepID=E1QUN6_VULDI|nr:MFS transporter [Vulcanisaeta distributa]ADN51155.1 major facilitator superfamily MFS_1 [Vulcanisaeta distributa DSM 14429]